jgi:hypothetical protein
VQARSFAIGTQQFAKLVGMTRQQVRKYEARFKLRIGNATGDAPANWGPAR